MKLLELGDSTIKFEVSCSKGTYIRTLCEDIAEKLGTVGTMEELERIRVDKFSIEDSINLENVDENCIIPIEQIFSNMPKINFSESDLVRFLNGIGFTSELKNALVYCDNKFIGIATNRNGKLIRDIVIEM